MATIIGYRRMSGTGKKSGNPYSGYLVYYTESLRVPLGTLAEGESCDSAYIDYSLLQGVIPSVGSTLELRYDKRGYLQDVNIA